MSKAKRVRFDKDEKDGDPVCASSRGRKEEAQSPRAGAPKTSEYAYFKKVKNGAVRGHSHSLHKENELKNSKISFLARDTSGQSDRIKPSMKDLRFSVSGEREGPSDHDLFLSPRISKKSESDSKKSKEIPNKIKTRRLFLSDQNAKPAGQSPCSPPPNKALENSELPNEFKARPSFHSQNVTVVGQSLFSPPLNKASENSETQCSDKGIFSSKRQRLRQWIAHTSYPEVEKLHPKVYDLVSALLSRLFPKDNESKDSSNRDIDNSKSSKSDKFSTLEKGLHLSYKRDCHKDLPIICSGRSSEIVPPGLNTFVSAFPFPNYGTESHAQDELMYLDQRSTNYIQKSSHTQHEFSFCSPFERYRPPGIFRLTELDDFGSMMEDTRKEPHRLLLGSDSECRNYISESSIITHDTARNVRPKLATSWNVDQRHIMDDVLDAERLCPSLSNHLLEFNSFPTPGSTSYLTNEFGSDSDDKKYAMAEPKQFSLALPSTPAEDGHSENVLCNSDIIFPYRNQHWLKDSVLDSKPPTDVFWNFLSAPAFSTENSPSIFHTWKFPENKKSLYSFPRLDEASGVPFTSLYESAFNRHISPSKFLSAEDPPSIFHTWKFPETKKSLYSFRRLDEAAFNRNISPSKFLSAAEDPPSIIHEMSNGFSRKTRGSSWRTRYSFL